MGILELAIRYRKNRLLHKPVRISWLLTLAFSIPVLFMLNYATSGTGEHCTWSFFGIWGKEITYIREAEETFAAIMFLFKGTHSMWLGLYTIMHLVPALMLAWAGAGVIAVTRVIILTYAHPRRQDRPCCSDSKSDR